MPHDDRTKPRHAMVRRVKLHYAGAEEVLSTFSTDIGKGGMFIRTEERPLPGSRLLLALTVDGLDGELTLPAVVVHTRADGVGVRFEPLDDKRTAAVDHLLTEAQNRVKAMAGVGPAAQEPAGAPGVRPEGGGLLEPGTLVDGRYRVLAHLASGGMGEVYRAEHVYMRRTLALKVLHPQFGHDEEMATRFQREAQIASSLDHPNIVRVFDFGKTGDGKLFLAMELVNGEQLEDLLVREGAMRPQRAVALMARICDAVHDAHVHGIIHRDLTLANVIVMRRNDEEEPKVLDFGIARLADEPVGGGKAVTRRGIVVGTPEYLSPEQALGQPIDSRADVYALGIMVYTLLAGRLPFYSENLRLVVTMQLTHVAPPLVDFAPVLRAYPGICAAVAKAMEKERDRRFATAALFGQALREGLADERVPGVFPLAVTPPSSVAVSQPTPEKIEEVTPCSRCGQGVFENERFCSACGTPVAPPCPRCQNPATPGARFCPACGLEFTPKPATSPPRPLTPAPSEPTAPTLARLQEVASLLPPRTFDAMVDARAQVRGEDTRYVTVLWITIGQGEPAARLRCLAAGLEVIHESGGVINLIGVNCVVAFFGALTAREDDSYRALTAGLEIQRRVRAASNGDAVDVRVGLHAGVAVPGEATLEDSPSTETVALARALAQAAAPGRVLASTSLGEASRPYLDTVPGPVLQPEGSTETLLSIQIEGFRAPARVNRPELCGREKEMAAFQKLAFGTEGGKTKPVLLVGAPGIGKTRLAEEVRRLVEGRGWAVATARQNPDAPPTRFGAVGELVLEMLRVPRAARHQALREALAGVLKRPADRAILEQVAGVSPRLGRLRAGAVASAVKTLEGELTRERPSLLVFEDLDRLDVGSRQVFRLLCDTHRPVGSLLFGISRSELSDEDRPSRASTYKVPALSAKGSLALIRSVLGDAEIPEQLAEIAKRAEGTPRRIVEYLHLLLDRRALVEGPSGVFLVQQPRDLPETSLELARERIVSLSADERYLLQVGALIGHSFDGQLLKRILAGLDVPGLIRDAQARGLLAPALSHAHFQFLTEEIRRAFVASLPPAEAAKLHRHLAESLRRQAADEGTPVPEAAIARHLSLAGDHQGAIQGLVRAASLDLAARNLTSAASWLAAAGAESVLLGAAAGTAQAAECFSRAASLAAAAGELELAAVPMEKALELLPAVSEGTIQSEIYLAQAAVARANGKPQEAHAAAQQAFTVFRGAVPAKRLALLASQAGAAAFASGSASEAVQLFLEALPTAEADRFAAWFGILDLKAQILADLGTAYASVGEVPTGADYLDQALRRVRPRRDFALEAQILRRLATLAENAGEGPSAASHHQAAAAAGENAGDLETAALEYYALARLKHEEGSAAEARAFVEKAQGICEEIGWEEGAAMASDLFGRPRAHLS